MKKLDIIIVNWNSGNQLFKCLESIQKANKDSFYLNMVYIIDNNSADDSLENLNLLDIPLEVMMNEENKGFGAACNQGAAKSNSDYILFLNPDTILFKDSLNSVIKSMNNKENLNIGVCGIKLIDESNKVQRSCCVFPRVNHFVNRSSGLCYINPKRFPTYIMSNWSHNENKEVDHVIGAFYLIRSEIFNSLGGFDERFFVYLEDLDLSYRVKCNGYKIKYFSDIEAFHKGGGVSEQVKALRLFYSLRSRLNYVYKHYSFINAFIVFFFTMFIEPITRIILGIFRLSFKNIIEIVKAYFLLWKEISIGSRR